MPKVAEKVAVNTGKVAESSSEVAEKVVENNDGLIERQQKLIEKASTLGDKLTDNRIKKSIVSSNSFIACNRRGLSFHVISFIFFRQLM